MYNSSRRWKNIPAGGRLFHSVENKFLAKNEIQHTKDEYKYNIEQNSRRPIRLRCKND